MRDDVMEMSDMDMALQLDPDTLDPEKHYRFCQERSTNIMKRRSQGYEVVLRSVHGVQLLSESDLGLSAKGTVDDMIRIGDSILMMCDLSRYKGRSGKTKRLSAARLGAQETKFEAEAKKRGVDVVKGERTKGEPK